MMKIGKVDPQVIASKYGYSSKAQDMSPDQTMNGSRLKNDTSQKKTNLPKSNQNNSRNLKSDRNTSKPMTEANSAKKKDRVERSQELEVNQKNEQKDRYGIIAIENYLF